MSNICINFCVNCTIGVRTRLRRAQTSLDLIKKCRDIVTEIPPHSKKMYPCDVCQMTPLDSELSNAALAMKIELC